MFISQSLLTIYMDVESKKSILSLKFPPSSIPSTPSPPPIHQKKTLLPFQNNKNFWGNDMNKYENHTDRRIRELHERMRKLGNKKSLA